MNEDPLPGEAPSPRPVSRLTWLFRFSGYWAGMTSLFALSGNVNCPCCGQPSCPIGIVNAGLFGAFCACGMNWFTHWKPKPLGDMPPDDLD